MDNPRNLIICIDGTNNEPGVAKTNVQRLFRVLVKEPGRQLVYYQPGVGTLDPVGTMGALRRSGLRLLDAMNAWMMQRHVGAAYRYLCEHYMPGDRIFLFGFSRGAYAVRVLAGMLSTVGLLYPGMQEMYPFAWKLYASYDPRSTSAGGRAPYCQATRSFITSYGRTVKVHFAGLWDTVSSVGNPWRPKVFYRTQKNNGVSIVRHAVSLDERRTLFLQNLWGDASAEQDIRQVWFAGVHADVGGGYKTGVDSQLAEIPFAWMLREAEQAGLLVDAEAVRKVRLPRHPKQVRHRAKGPMHDELIAHPWWRLLEHVPIPRRTRRGDGWGPLSYRPHRGRARTLFDGALIHYSVFERMIADDAYQPVNLPGRVVIVD